MTLIEGIAFSAPVAALAIVFLLFEPVALRLGSHIGAATAVSLRSLEIALTANGFTLKNIGAEAAFDIKLTVARLKSSGKIEALPIGFRLISAMLPAGALDTLDFVLEPAAAGQNLQTLLTPSQTTEVSLISASFSDAKGRRWVSVTSVSPSGLALRPPVLEGSASFGAALGRFLQPEPEDLSLKFVFEVFGQATTAAVLLASGLYVKKLLAVDASSPADQNLSADLLIIAGFLLAILTIARPTVALKRTRFVRIFGGLLICFLYFGYLSIYRANLAKLIDQPPKACQAASEAK